MVTFNSLADWQKYGDGSTSLVDQYLAKVQANSSAINAFNATQAQKMMDFQTESNAKAMEFNHREAELNRNWQEMMSNTAHQREVQDLLNAGLNPVLSATGGNGAAVTSGATASGVTSSGAQASADNSVNASLSGAMQSLVNATVQRDIADISATTAMRNSDIAAAVQHYVADLTRVNVLDQIGAQFDFAEQYPNNAWQFSSSVIRGLLGVDSVYDAAATLGEDFNKSLQKIVQNIPHKFASPKLLENIGLIMQHYLPGVNKPGKNDSAYEVLGGLFTYDSKKDWFNLLNYLKNNK